MTVPDRVIYLHIGTEKTGTTAIQSIGRAERDRLRDHGIYYPQLPGDSNHVKLTLYAAADKNIGEIRRAAGLYDESTFNNFRSSFPGELKDEIEQSRCGVILLSNEHLSSRLQNVSEISKIASIFGPLGVVKVICCLRPQHELVISANSSSIKAGGTRIRPPPTDDRDYYYNYYKMLSNWAEVFGDSNITVKIYERKTLVTDFFSIIGYKPASEGTTARDRNPTLDITTLRFLMMFNKHIPAFQENRPNRDRGDVFRALEAITTDAKSYLSALQLRQIFGLFENSNAAVAKRFLHRRDGVLFPDVKFVEPAETEALTVEKAVEIAAHLWRWKTSQVHRLRQRIALLHQG